MPVNANYRVPDPDCELNFVLGQPRRQRVRMAMSNSFGFGGSNSCVVLRHPEASRRWPRGVAGLTDRHEPTPEIVITASGAVCAAGMDPRAILGALLEGRSAIGPIKPVGHHRLAGAHRRRGGRLNPRALVEDRKLHKLIRRTDLFGLYAAGRAIEARACSRTARRSTPTPRRSTATAAASTSARAAATTRTSTTTCR